MERKHKISVIGILFPILLASMALMVVACEWIISASGRELRTRALETSRAEVSYISEAFYTRLNDIQLQNVDILNNESVLALSMRSSILDRYETVSYESAIMKLIRFRMTQLNLNASAQLYLPSIRTMITTQKAAEVTDAELEEIREIIRVFPNGMFYTEESMGFWSASPLIHDASAALNSRIMITRIRRDSLRDLLQKYTPLPNGYQLLLTYGDHVIASSHDTQWERQIFSESGEDVRTVMSGGRQYYVIRARHDYSDVSFVAVLPVDNVMSNMYRMRRMLRTLECVCILIVLLAVSAFYRIICRPLKGMSAKMQQVGDGDLSVRMVPEKTAELDDVASTFNGMAERLQRLIDREYKSRLLAAGAEKKALQYQISPHFLYNTYFQLRNLILVKEYEQARRLADLMGRYLRYIVHQAGTSATLGEEMDHARNYAEIQGMRFQGRIEVRCDVPDGPWRDLIVPRLLVQPLIENAFGHGLKNVEKDGVILLSLRQEENLTAISVEDNGGSLSEDALEALRTSVSEDRPEENDGVALINIHRRLQLHFGPESGLRFDRSQLGGLKVTVLIVPGKEEA